MPASTLGDGLIMMIAAVTMQPPLVFSVAEARCLTVVTA